MQRQSLGSPGSKLHGNTHGGLLVVAKEDNGLAVEDQKRKQDLTLSSFASAAGNAVDDDDELRKSKPQKQRERMIHLIPLLTVLCFLILYLSSHDPSQKDLAQFNGFKRLSKPIESAEIDDFGRFMDIAKGDVLAIRSLRNLQEVNLSDHNGRRRHHHRLHRKIGHIF